MNTSISTDTKRFSRPALSTLVLLGLLVLAPGVGAAQSSDAEVDVLALMKRAERFTLPGEHHELLDRFLGTWDSEFRLVSGGRSGEPEKGTATFSWLIEERWLQMQWGGTIMGMPSQTFMLLGYDNFKMSYVSATVGNLDTALLVAEGDLDPSGKALISYGTHDEYTTGEHDKTVKYVWRFLSEDEMRLEVHDLAIGEADTQVLDFRFVRRD
jgi:hypothetical protein